MVNAVAMFMCGVQPNCLEKGYRPMSAHMQSESASQTSFPSMIFSPSWENLTFSYVQNEERSATGNSTHIAYRVSDRLANILRMG
jgi:hypothetical protein